MFPHESEEVGVNIERLDADQRRHVAPSFVTNRETDPVGMEAGEDADVQLFQLDVGVQALAERRDDLLPQRFRGERDPRRDEK